MGSEHTNREFAALRRRWKARRKRLREYRNTLKYKQRQIAHRPLSEQEILAIRAEFKAQHQQSLKKRFLAMTVALLLTLVILALVARFILVIIARVS